MKGQKRKRRPRSYVPYATSQREVAKMHEQKYQPRPIIADENFQLMKNTEVVVDFVNRMRKQKNWTKYLGKKYVEIDLSRILQLDFSAVCGLLAEIENLRNKGVQTRGKLPIDEEIKNKLIDSGFVNSMYDAKGNRFETSAHADHYITQTGARRFTLEQNRRISEIVKKIMFHLTGESKHCVKLRNVFLEICANSLEWAGTKRWLIGVKYEEQRVIVIMADVGDGILGTLKKKNYQQLKDFISRSEIDVISGAFDKEYGSRSGNINRNKGLPAIKQAHKDGVLKELKVLTNNVAFSFDDVSESVILPSKFNGTLYRWLVDKDCIE